MTFAYSNFLAKVKEKGLAVQNRFQVVFSQPACFEWFGLSDISLMCKSVSVPGVNVATSSERIIGEVREIPYDRNFGAANLTFWVNSQFDTREYFERWIDGIQNPNTRILSYYNDIKTDVVITTLNKMDEPVFETKLYAAHPKSIGQLSLDNESTGAMTLDVTFDYHHYSMKKL